MSETNPAATIEDEPEDSEFLGINRTELDLLQGKIILDIAAELELETDFKYLEGREVDLGAIIAKQKFFSFLHKPIQLPYGREELLPDEKLELMHESDACRNGIFEKIGNTQAFLKNVKNAAQALAESEEYSEMKIVSLCARPDKYAADVVKFGDWTSRAQNEVFGRYGDFIPVLNQLAISFGTGASIDEIHAKIVNSSSLHFRNDSDAIEHRPEIREDRFGTNSALLAVFLLDSEPQISMNGTRRLQRVELYSTKYAPVERDPKTGELIQHDSELYTLGIRKV